MLSLNLKLGILVLTIFVASLGLNSCSKQSKREKVQHSSTFIEPYDSNSSLSGELGYTALEHWEKQDTSHPMRLDQYLISKNGLNAELAVYFFPGKVRGVEANLDRWDKQFKDDSSKLVHSLKQFNQGGLPITIALFEGTYIKNLRPMMPNSPTKEISNQAMLGTIVETKEGLWFFKMLGDKELVLNESQSFQDFVKTFRLS